MGWFRHGSIYVQVFRDRLQLLDGDSGQELELTAAFSHPRMLIDDFPLAEQLLRGGLRQLKGARWWPPYLILHPRELLEGGLSLIERRVLRELGLGAGARVAVIWGGEAVQGIDRGGPGLRRFPDSKRPRSCGAFCYPASGLKPCDGAR